VLFSGGRGSQALSRELAAMPGVRLTIAVNGYDDGASTGEVRRFLGDALGPSDFRKNASRMARALGTCSAELIDLLDLRFPEDYSAQAAAQRIAGSGASAGSGGETAETASSDFDRQLGDLAAALDSETRATLTSRLDNFQQELVASGRAFSFSDCSLGNLVFAGCYLETGGDFNEAIDDYCALCRLPLHLIENVTDGTDAHLVAVNKRGQLLASEADIVDATRRNHIQEIHLIDRPPTPQEHEELRGAEPEIIQRYLKEHSTEVSPNPRVLARIAEADLIVYAPGTQHSSLLPSYLTTGLGSAIATNLRAVKVLVTNLEEDAEIPGLSAVDIIERAVYYLKAKNQHSIPTPCLITHSVINDPTRPEAGTSYVPLGQLQSLEDPRLVRVANYEDGTTGYHSAEKVIAPFIESLLVRRQRQSVAVLLLDANSLNKVTQTLLEALRGGLEDLPIAVTFFYWSPESLPIEFTSRLSCDVQNVWSREESANVALLGAVRGGSFDYTALFESSGMYRGEDIINLLALLNTGRLDSVWGSRRLSVRDIRQSYKLRYEKTPLLGAISYAGSHLLSLTFLILYGRHISDTLSGARALRTKYLEADAVDLDHKRLNHYLLSMLLRDGGEIFEAPVRFFPMSPEKVKRTTIGDGLQSIASILGWRLRSRPRTSNSVPGGPQRAPTPGSPASEPSAPKPPLEPPARPPHKPGSA
jgi:2-phospho-L-lactate transferase/gluconeogenesis factor (CofD/UPF0052 family)